MAPSSPFAAVALEIAALDAADDTFALTPAWRVPTALFASVGRVGVVVPLLVEAAGRGFRIVDGFGRRLAAAHHGLDRVPALVAAPADPVDRFLRRLEARITARPLDELEAALALSKLKHRFNMSESELVSRVLPLMDLKAERFQLRRHLDLAAIDPRLQQALPQLQSGIAVKLSRWSGPEQALFLRLLDRYRLGVNHQKEAFQLLDELRHAASPPDGLLKLWEETGAAAADHDSSNSPQERLRHILAALQRARYPTLQAMQSQAEQLRAALRLPPQIHFHWPRFFEGDRLRVEFSFRTPEELASLAEQLEAAAARDELKQLIELL